MTDTLHSQPGPANPFPGLRAFQSEEDHLFFGREEQTAHLLGILREQRFVAVVGTSGSGKSSLVRAGLIPALHGGTMSQAGTHWEVAILRPGGDPIRNLAAALLAADLYDNEDAEALPRLLATLSRSRFGLAEAVRQSDIRDAASNILVVVDQFEELFRFRGRSAASEEVSEAFIKLLLTASREEMPRVYVVLTMRSDYLGDCAQIPGLAEAVNQGEYLIPRLTRNQQRAAIEKPVGVGGARIAPRLVQQLLNDVGGADDQLPVLQHALMRTWDVWVADHAPDEPVDLRHYEATGGMAEALSRHADEVFASLPSDSHREICARLFMALTMKGADNRGIRRPWRLDRLARIAGAGEVDVRIVVDAYRQPGVTFLMPGAGTELGSDTVIDLSHESLMRVWRRLSAWVEEEAQSARIYRRLTETAALWQEGQAGLYHDPDLQIARTWCEGARPNADWAEQYGGGFDRAMMFLQRSREARAAAEQEREVVRQRELEQAKRLAEAERRRLELQQRAAGRLRIFAAGLAVVAALAIVACVVALKAWNLATEKEHAANKAAATLKQTVVASDFAQGVDHLEQGDGAEGLAYLARALRTDASFWPAAMRAQSSLASGRFPLRTFDPIEQDRVITTHRWNEEENLLFTSDAVDDAPQAESLVWDAVTGQRLYRVASGQKLTADTSWTPDGKYLVVFANSDNVLRVLEARSGREVSKVDLPDGLNSFRTGVHPRDGALVLGRLPSGHLQLWKAATGQASTPLLQRSAPAWDDFGFTPDGRRVHGACTDATLAVWDAASGALVAEISTRPHRTRSGQGGGAVVFSPDGELVVARADGSRHFNWWHVGSEGETAPEAPGPAWLELDAPASAFLLPGARKVAFIVSGGSTPPRVVVHDLATREETARIERPAGQLIRPASARPDELAFAIIGVLEANFVRLWDLETGVRLTEVVLPLQIARAELSPEGRRLLTASIANEVMLWDVFTGQPLLPRPLAHDGVPSAWFTPDGEKLVTFDPTRLVLRAWDSRSGRGLVEPIPQWLVSRVYFPAGGRRLLVHEFDRTRFGQVFDRQTTGRFRLFDLDPRPDLHTPLLDDTTFATGAGAESWYVAGGKDILVVGPQKPQEPDEVLLFDAASRSLRQAIGLPAGVTVLRNVVALSDDGRWLAASCSDRTARVWDLARGVLLQQLGHEDAVEGIALSADGSRVATGTVGGKARVWDAASGALLVGPLEHGNQHIHGMHLQPGGALGVSTSVDLRIRFFDARTGEAPFEPITVDNVFEMLDTGFFSADGSHFVALPASASIPVIDASTGKVARTLRHPSPCSTAALSPDGRLLAVGTKARSGAVAGAVHLWDWRSGSEASRPLDPGAPVEQIAFSRDGKLLATGTSQGTVQVWDVVSGLSLIDPVAGRGSVATVSFHPAATEVVAAWSFGSVRVIELPARSAEQPAWLPRLCEAVAGRKLSADGTRTEPALRADLDAIRAELRSQSGAAPADDAAKRWAEWFLAEPAERAISPGARLGFRDYLVRLRQSSIADDLRGVLRLDPTDALTYGRLGFLLVEELGSRADLNRQPEVNAALRRHWQDSAAWYGRRAAELAPDNVEAWTLQADLLQRLGRVDAASFAAARAMELDPSRAEGTSPNALYLQAVALGAAGQWAEADALFARAVDGLTGAAAPNAAGHQSGVPLLGVLADLAPRRDRMGVSDIRLPAPIPGTFEDFDSTPEGQIPRGWSVRHAPREATVLPAASGRLDTATAEVFDDWTCVAVDRVLVTAGAPYWRDRLLALRHRERVNGLLPSALLHGRFLYAVSGARGGAGDIQEVVTPDFDCSGRSAVHVAFHSAYEQASTGGAGLEYSIDEGKTWLPVLYRLPSNQLVRDRVGKIDAPASLEAVRFTPPLYLGEDGRPRAATLGSLIGGRLDRELDRVIEGLVSGVSREGKRVELFRLERADGQARVRLRFLQAGRAGWYWGIDAFGLHEIPDGAVTWPPVLFASNDSFLLSTAALALGTLRQETRMGSAFDPGASILASAASVDMPAIGPGASALSRNILDARLLAGRALALAPENPAVLQRALVVSTFAGLEDASRALANKLLGTGMLDLLSAQALVPYFRRCGEFIEARGEIEAAGVAYETTFALSLAALGAPDRVAVERLAAVGLLTPSVVFVPRGAVWSYLDDGSEPGSSWKDPAFDDNQWLTGAARLGYGGDGEVTVVRSGTDARAKHITTYFRAAFSVEDVSRLVQLRLAVSRDDGVAVHLNGQEVVRDNLPEGLLGRRTQARTTINDEEEKRFLSFTLPVSLLRAGRNVIAAEVHQSSATSTDLGFDLELEGIGGLKDVARDPAALEAIAERLGLSAELRGVLWVARAERERRAANVERAAEALALAARLDPANPAIAGEKALQLAARGEAAAARESFLAAAAGTTALKTGPRGSLAIFLSETLRTLEPIVAPTGLSIAAAAERVMRSASSSRELEAGWLLDWSTALDPAGHEARLQRLEVWLLLGKLEEARAVADAALSAGPPAAEAPPRAVREHKEWLQMRERILRRLGQSVEADLVRAEIIGVPPRHPALSARAIDLSSHFNASLHDGRGWHAAEHLRTLAETFHSRDGVPHDIRGLIQLNSGPIPEDPQPAGPPRDMNIMHQKNFPDAVRGMAVGQPARALHFILGCAWGRAVEGVEVGHFTVHYEDGTAAEIPLRMGEDLIDWHFSRFRTTSIFDPERYAWLGGNPLRGLTRKVWMNPTPEKSIASLDFVSARAAAAPFLVAVTVQ